MFRKQPKWRQIHNKRFIFIEIKRVFDNFFESGRSDENEGDFFKKEEDLTRMREAGGELDLRKSPGQNGRVIRSELGKKITYQRFICQV